MNTKEIEKRLTVVSIHVLIVNMNGDNIIKIDICGSCFLLIDMRLERVIGLRECLLKTDKIRW